MSKIIKNRSEIVFLYDIKDANPNGDPLDENKPRLDEETGINIVTDVRLKRTIRDYFLELIEHKDPRLQGQDIFIREIRNDDGYLYDAKERVKYFKKTEGKFNEIKAQLQKEICSKCIDIRLFGAMIPIEFKIPKTAVKSSEEDELDSEKETSKKGKKRKSPKEKPEKGAITLIGPVQFRMGRSLHKVNIKFMKGSGAFASDYPSTTQFTFREEYVLPYSLISFYGIINENNAQHTTLQQEDVDLLMEGLWKGTKNLVTRTKFGQMPRLLIKIDYKVPNFHIGDLNTLIKAEHHLPDLQLRDITEILLNVVEFIKNLQKNKEKIAQIELAYDEKLFFLLPDGDNVKKGGPLDFKNILAKDFMIKELAF